ncbi:glycoside hydrolase family 6 protein [Streptomyces xanthii]|uniref:Glucanase n=1 Tax=Streptomyces xanthii TaxID=2768069 RepID=A0A7H1BDQ8_9ACTN|nr:glycoside hydrolase family 6 protein [Streptomyces xanthii]QNS06863.1 glycoside hydrolase family 6 protein [Streptomyces xanthii]
MAKSSRPVLGVLLAALLSLAPAAAGHGARAGAVFWVDPDSAAARQAAAYRAQDRTADAELVDRIAGRPQAVWLGGTDPGPTARAVTEAAARAGRTAVLVAYHIPHRDCGSYSAGGAPDAAAYRAYIDSLASGLGSGGAYVVVEPDAVASAVAGCPGADTEERYALLSYAVQRLAARPGTRVYLDAGNAGWIPDPARLVDPLRRSGVAAATGIALNVANYRTNAETSAYGHRLLAALGGTPHFVIDSSRNGNGPYEGTDAWCNPPGRALGTPPTTGTADPALDAYLWIKRPGESDGTCRGGPPAGQWWESGALELARNSTPRLTGAPAPGGSVPRAA